MSELESQRWAENQAPTVHNLVVPVLTPDMTLRECAAKIGLPLASVRACAKNYNLPFKRERRSWQKFHAESFK